MAQSPKLKIYNSAKEYIGCVKYFEDAAALVSIQDDGATVRYGHTRVLWTQGVDGNAGESYDGAAEIMRARFNYVYDKAEAALIARRSSTSQS